MKWRTRLSLLAALVGIICGLVASAYTVALHYLLEQVWLEPLPQRYFATAIGGALPPWTYIIVACTVLGFASGVAVKLMGPPMIKCALTRLECTPASDASTEYVRTVRCQPARCRQGDLRNRSHRPQ